METRHDDRCRVEGIHLETFLVEWKRPFFIHGTLNVPPLETFLVEWKHVFPKLGDYFSRALKPS